MKLRHRLSLMAFGIFLCFFGFIKFNRGQFMWQNGRNDNVFAPAVMATGAVFALLALLPPYRRIDKK